MAVGAGYGLIPEEGGGGSSPRYRLIVPVWVRDGWERNEVDMSGSVAMW